MFLCSNLGHNRGTHKHTYMHCTSLWSCILAQTSLCCNRVTAPLMHDNHLTLCVFLTSPSSLSSSPLSPLVSLHLLLLPFFCLPFPPPLCFNAQVLVTGVGTQEVGEKCPILVGHHQVHVVEIHCPRNFDVLGGKIVYSLVVTSHIA